jgi:hypothetical protein
MTTSRADVLFRVLRILQKALGFISFASTSTLSESIEAARRCGRSEIFPSHRIRILKAIQTRAGFGETSSSSGGLPHRMIPILR